MRSKIHHTRRERWHQMCCQQPFPYETVSTVVFVADQKYVPHACQKLNEATVAESERDDDSGSAQTESAHVDQREDERSECKGRETERSGISEFAAFDTLVKTWLEFTTESWIRQHAMRLVSLKTELTWK